MCPLFFKKYYIIRMGKKILKGDQIQMWDWDNGTLAYATSHTLTLTGNTIDTKSKDNGWWGSTAVGNITWELTAECLYTDNDFDSLFTKMISNQKIHLVWGEVKNYDKNGLTTTGGSVTRWVPETEYYSGYAYITSLNTNANTGENATFSLTLTGNGALQKEDNSITQYVMYVKYKQSALKEGMQLFDQRAQQYVNSCWVYEEGHENDKERIDISDCTLHDATPDQDAIFMYYLSGGSVPKYMFYNNNNILEVSLTVKIGEIEQSAFANSSVTIIYTENTIKYGQSCFSGCTSLTSINEDQNHVNNLDARRIDNDAFRNCVRLGDISTGENCEYILHHAFAGCLMSTVYFGSMVDMINECAFDNRTGVTTFHFYSDKSPDMPTDGVPPLNQIGYQSFIIHGNDLEYFLYDTDQSTELVPRAMAQIYPQRQCDYQLASGT